ncbi:SMI1/KNR4 family protein [Nonomuraea sp. NPDC005650]|uniref:SMI1/KNR4 family protein n=1 Tax=Nonomuraea sp. NPDC005650 TaxID=3157045 RepID=UPI0033A14022
MATMTTRLDRLRAIENDRPVHLHKFYRRNTRFLIFGAEGHQYRNTPLDPTSVLALEGELGVQLPPAYREFLLQIGPGAGPYYGIWEPQEIVKETEGDPAKPFPLTRRDAEEIYNAWSAWVREPEPDSGGGPSIQAPDPTPGCIFIGTQGCSAVTALVTTGELTGTVWDVSLDASAWRPAKTAPASLESELYDLATPTYLGPMPTFDAWYEAWLTRADAELSPPEGTS